MHVWCPSAERLPHSLGYRLPGIHFVLLTAHVYSLQLVALRVRDLENMQDLCHQGHVNCDSDLAKGLVILGDWARGMSAVLDEAWTTHRIQLPQDMSKHDRLKRSCYSNAIKYRGPNKMPDWEALYPLPPALAKPTDWLYEDEDDGDDEEAGFIVTPMMAMYLSQYLQELGDSGYLSKRLPTVAERYAGIEAWCENLEECAFRMKARLEKGLQPGDDKLARCTGEHFILRSLAYHNDLGLIEDISYLSYGSEDLPRCKYDLCLEKLVEKYTHNHDDVMMFFEEDNIPISELNFSPYVHPADWFKTLDFGEEGEILNFMDHVHSDRTSLEERGEQVLQKSELLGNRLSPKRCPVFHLIRCEALDGCRSNEAWTLHKQKDRLQQ